MLALNRCLGMSFRRMLPIPQMHFSKYFDEKDKSEMYLYFEKKIIDKRYQAYKNKWQEDLKRKQLRRERQKVLDASRKNTEPQESKFVVHNPREVIEVPPNPDGIFAVVEISGRQFKVTKDDMVVSDYIAELDINDTIELQKVLMLGTRDYTCLGRPYVQTAKVYATVEQQTLSDKMIILKKLRRKRYRKSMGHRQDMTILRINEIVHNVGEEELSRAVSLI